VIVAAGSGTRFGGAKQYAALGGRTVLERSVSAARVVCDGVVVVVPAGDELAPEVTVVRADVVIAGGATRSASVRAGLTAVPVDADVIVVHDAARPLASPALFEAAVAGVEAGADGAICAVPIVDALKRVDGERVVGSLDRIALVAAQTPQAFRASVLRAAHAGLPEEHDDAAVVEAHGGKVVIVAGDPRNLKLTTVEDVALGEAFLS
jgi:2-C-methyl-D-erythritol 4-phosphate cytidylyltransferase